MDSEYDQKFEEMKKYIPFLENMIKRLESSEQTSNPRQAQLDKIRSLRDLLLDKKKRMKMENLLKCEQVLINLYAKVEQRNMHQSGDIEKTSTEKDKTDLNAVRNKLKSMVTSKFNVQETTETLPEIARASKTEEIRVQGTKEPALFQRRPNKGSNSVNTSSLSSAPETEVTPSKRNYTRVLQSPEANETRWRSSVEKPDQQLFSRRSPHRRTELSSRKERKKLKQKEKKITDDLNVTNITLQVPEESLSSLNTDDILSRIINCSDGDVDINTLRELRTQILGELKKTGSKDDISDLILKSYKNKDKRKKNDEMEDGELSDSESETIKNVYSSIVVLDKDKKAKASINESTDSEAPRIQICLVFNNKEQVTPKASSENKVDITDFENYHDDKSLKKLTKDKPDNSLDKKEINYTEIKSHNDSATAQTTFNSTTNDANVGPESNVKKNAEIEISENVISNSSKLKVKGSEDDAVTDSLIKSVEHKDKENRHYGLVEENSSTLAKSSSNMEKLDEIKAYDRDTIVDGNVDIPLLNIEETSKKEVESEIDILQALKKEILSETSTVLHTNVDTPALHQPKITKVQNTSEIGLKKRISIENYKAKTTNPIENKIIQKFPPDTDSDLVKKQSLKLTEKECERFNFLSKIALHDSSDDEEQFSLHDIYTDLAPKSPDHEDFADTGLKPPVIIPNDPIDKIVTTTDSDVDMRKLISVEPNATISNAVVSNSSTEIPDTLEHSNVGKDFYVESVIERKIPLLDPRTKRDSIFKIDTPESKVNSENTSRSIGGFCNFNSSQCNSTRNIASALAQFVAPNAAASLIPNITPVPGSVPFADMSPVRNMSPILSHNANVGTSLVPPLLPPVLANNIIGNMTPIMTPNARTYEMTPSRLSNDSEDFNKNKHVYPPMFTNYDTHGSENKSEIQRKEWKKRENRIPVWEREINSENKFSVWEESESRNSSLSRDKNYQGTHDTYTQGYNDNKYRYDNRDSYNRLECPRTPIHSFGRLDCPPTPTPSFGRLDCPPTPTPSFGRLDCPPTPTPSFGRSDMPTTTVHSFGRSDYLQRPTNSKHADPRRSRFSDYNNRDDEWERRHFNERDYSSNSYRPNLNNHSRNNYDPSRQYGRETSLGRYDRYEGNRRSHYRETSVGNSFENDYEDNYYSNRRSGPIRDDYNNQTRTNRDYYQRGYRDYNIEKSKLAKTYEHDNIKNNKIIDHSNTIKSYAIDTNVSKTYQIHSSVKHTSKFDARRRRAASVGRTIDSDSVETKSNPYKEKDVFNIERNKERFRRAASVGRVVSKALEDFNSIKEDLKSFKLKSDTKKTKPLCNADNMTPSHKSLNNTECRELYKKKNDKSLHDKKINVSSRYSPKKNFRDPRVRQDTRSNSKLRYDDTKAIKHQKNHGIVYSNDNLSKGTILGSGYGVKNYKIPKLKRHSTESEITETIETKTDSTKKDARSDVKISLKGVIDKDEKNSSKQTIKIENTEKVSRTESNEKINIDLKTKNVLPANDNNLVISAPPDTKDIKVKIEDDFCKPEEDVIERRITRSSRKKIIDKDTILRDSPSLRKSKKIAKIYYSESDSDEESLLRCKQKNTNEKDLALKNDIGVAALKEPEKGDKNDNSIKDNSNKEEGKKVSSISTETSKNTLKCSVDSLETFEENVVSDPVIDSINSLIADLDHDLGVDAAKDESIENENIEKLDTSQKVIMCSDSKPDKSELKPGKPEECTEKESERTEPNDVSLLQDNLKKKPIKHPECENKLQNSPTQKQKLADELNNKKEESNNTKDQLSNDGSSPIKQMNPSSNDSKNLHLEPVVSTTGKCDNEEESINYIEVEATAQQRACTDDANNLETLPDSTGVSENVVNCSTEVSTNFVADTEEHTKSDDQNEISLEQKLLLLLKDKIKMKELISKLSGDSSENDKIKKKLEKLSEIVSDDDENIQNEENIKDSEIEKDDKTHVNFDSNKKTAVDSLNSRAVTLGDNTEPHKITEIEDDINKQCHSTVEKERSNISASVEERPENMCENDSSLKLNISDCIKDTQEIEQNVYVQDENVEIENENKLGCEKKLSTDTLSKQDGVEEANELEKVGGVEEAKKSEMCLQDQNNILLKEKPNGRKNKKKGKLNKNVKPLKNNISVKAGQSKVKKPSRELKRLQDDLREVYMKEDILASTGIRMCRLAKMVNDHRDGLNVTENESVIEVQKPDDFERNVTEEKETPTSFNSNNDSESKTDQKSLMRRPGPKSKTKPKTAEENNDPYEFETDSVNESVASESKNESSSDSDSELNILSNNTATTDKERVEKKKNIRRKRSNRGWQAGIIKPKTRKKIDTKSSNNLKIPDYSCFTDKTYCFKPNTMEYSCRLCVYTGADIIPHYMKHHPHSEIPLSRLCPDSAAEAMKQCEEVNFKAISKMPSKKYTCRFCFKEIAKKKFILEDFFWHVVSTHTGEYKQQCPECEDVSKCPFNNDIPPPPENVKGQLLGYICSKCNFTQVSMENLKTHVIIRHNNEETHVYTINLSVVSKKSINIYLKNSEKQNSMSTIDEPRKLRSTRSKQSLAESSDDENSASDTSVKKPEPEVTNFQSKLTFECDILTETASIESSIKIEPVQEVSNKNDSFADDNKLETVKEPLDKTEEIVNPQNSTDPTVSNDIFTYPHFKVTNANGLKEYVCCINGNDFHYKTSLLISIRKHVQMKHHENWDGYCSMCKVIVTPQGKHNFKDCLNHYIDKHMDDFPTVEHSQDEDEKDKDKTQQVDQEKQSDKNITVKTYINVKPLEQLMSTANETENADDSSSGLPVIESVVSLNLADQPLPSPNYPKSSNTQPAVEYKYEEAQADLMSKKHRVVLDAMMNNTHLVQIFKCAGKFCSFTTDNAEEALLHASTHVKIGGEYALCCVYCDYDASGNAIDLVTHVFKKHGCCPYVCGVCFYRAAASQLVQAHISRVHPNSNAQVLRTTVVTGATDDDDCLPRNVAVPFYRCCGDQDTPNPCKFRTYTPGKFCEHIEMRHINAAQHLCFICSEASSSSTELVRHLKVHGLKLYQCTRCVYGADNEPELLGHASAKHPYKQPTAYLRIITNKEGSAELKVLPLAHLNNSKVSVTEVIPNVSAKNPVREAERARELEALIGETTSMIESISTSVDTSAEPATPTPLEPPTAVPSLARDASSPVLPTLLARVSLPPRMTTPPAGRSDSPQRSAIGEVPISMDRESVTSNISNVPAATLHLIKPKIEPSDLDTIDDETAPSLLNVEADLAPDTIDPPATTTAASGSVVKNNINIDHVVYCLDSDEEVGNENVIDLSDERPLAPVAGTSTTTLVELFQLFKCGKCKMVMRSGHGLKRHFRSCYGWNPDTVPCAYCDMVLQKSMIDSHLMASHLREETGKFGYVCPVCLSEFKSISAAQDHFKALHLDTHHKKVFWKIQQVGNHTESYSQAQKVVKVDQLIQESRPKRKRSVGNKDKAAEPLEKVKKFGPLDIDKLPINPILDDLVYCALCEFSTKVKLNMVRHLQLHAQQQPVADTAPVNPVPHLETNEMHFDKMLNLASSSRAPDKPTRGDQTPRALGRIPLDIVGRYPKYVPDRQRHTCGAKDCSYISVDENMLKCHWETLHSGTTDYHCVHCPPTQHLNGQITTGRIINHLKMHDFSLYACSLCPYYHYKVPIVEKHLNDVHKRGEVLIVRDESSVTVAAPPPAPAAAPTMDLKPWQCGLCQFKSLLRPEVVEHCAKVHNSKMQYKCGYCAFRTSNLENIPKHQSTSHAGRPEEIFYYYYREGSVPSEAGGTPRWMKQKQKMGSTSQVKSEVVDSSPAPPVQAVVLPAIVQKVDLNLVKKEIADVDDDSDLCQEFGEFCEPNGLKYKCPLCQSVTEDTEELMQCHLYEELKYRKWGCPVCSYKAFHKAGFREHVQTEHKQFPNLEAHPLPVNPQIELWTVKLLEHQKTLIAKNKEKLAIQKAEIKRTYPSAGTQNLQSVASQPPATAKPLKKSSKEVEALFGTYGRPSGVLYCCPKCNTTFKEENDMREHLETELSKIRWYCNNCSQTFTTYHEAQFHCSARCKSTQAGVYSRPTEATRDASLRSDWIESAVQSQTVAIDKERSAGSEAPQEALSEQNENSLLVVRYEQQVSTPEEEMARPSPRPPEADAGGPAESSKREAPINRCPHCSYITHHAKLLTSHVLKHYDLKACSCPYCGLGGNRKQVTKHQRTSHPQEPVRVIDTVIPAETPQEYFEKKFESATKLICLVCRKPFTESASKAHRHNNFKPDFGKDGEFVVMCCVCSMLYKEVTGCLNHHRACHPQDKVNYAICKLSAGPEVSCSECTAKFSSTHELKAHILQQHPKESTSSVSSDINTRLDTSLKRKSKDDAVLPARKVAKKSTSKQPRPFARKSTTKLPLTAHSEEYSYYGVRRPSEDLDKSILIPFCNTMMPFTVRKVPEIFGNPVVSVKKLSD